MTFDPERKDWSILVENERGVMSFIRGLTMKEAKDIYERFDVFYGDYWEPGESNITASGKDCRVEVFGPEGWDVNDINSWSDWPRHRTTDQQ